MNEEHTVQKDFVVNFEYTVHLDNGDLLDQSKEGEPFTYLHGHSNIIPGLEEAITGMHAGESGEFVIPPAKAYGEHIEDAEEWLPRIIFPPNALLRQGAAVTLEDGEGGIIMVHLKEVEDDRVLVDYNHPLAGETLHFKVKVTSVRPATPEELAHHHVHSHGAHHH